MREEENRRSVDVVGKKLKLAFPRKSKLPLAEWQLSCHHHVNDSSRSRHATRSICYRLDAPTVTLTIVFA